MKTSTQPSDEYARKFIDSIDKELNAGFGYVLLTGAGLSADAGIPVIAQLSNYLQRCIALSLGISSDSFSRENCRRWRPRSDEWPSLRDSVTEIGANWFDLIYSEWKSKISNPDWDPEVQVFQEALGALAEWRTSLIFLSRIDTEWRGIDNQENVFLTDPRQDVIDAFFLHVTSGRLPSLSHRMLPHISNVLRSNLMLTTNFDELTEDAFAAAGKTLKVFDIHLNSELPHLISLRGHHGLIKLHGGRYSLRADYSLDSYPKEADRERFVDYLTDSSLSINNSSSTRKSHYHLLIAGISAADRRTVYFLTHALKVLKELKLFWLCYTKGDLERVNSFAASIDRADAIIAIRVSDLGLFFQQLYQSIAKTLPPSGIIYPSNARLPIPPEPASISKLNVHGMQASNQLYNRVLTLNKKRFSGNRLVLLTSSSDICGGVTVASTSYNLLRDKGYCCIWLDLSDVTNTDDLFEQMLDAVWNATGYEEWLPVDLEKNPIRRSQEINRAISGTQRKWVIFLNAREKAGSNFEIYSKEYPNGWIDIVSNNQQPSMHGEAVDDNLCTRSFVELVISLTGRMCPDLTVVLLCYDSYKDSTMKSTDSNVIHEFRKYSELKQSGFPTKTWIKLEEPALKYEYRDVIDDVFEWAGFDKTRHAFLQIMVMMQRTRYPAAFTDDTITEICPELCHAPINVWLAELEDFQLLRRKSGGFIWLFMELREAIRKIYYTIHNPKYDYGQLDQYYHEIIEKYKDFNFLCPSKSHCGIALWYERVYSSSNRPDAVFESVYHILQAISYRMDLDDSKKLCIDNIEKLKWARMLLRKSEHTSRTRGFSKSSCRSLCNLLASLSDLIKKACNIGDGTIKNKMLEAVHDLQKQCIITMRGIAKEMSENVTCFKRHCELRKLIVLGDPNIPLANNGRTEIIQDFIDGESLTLARAFQLWTRGYRKNDSINKPSARPTPHLWIKWWRWSGTIAYSGRSLSAAEASLIRALDGFTADSSTRRLRRIIPKTSFKSPDRQNNIYQQNTIDAFSKWIDSVMKEIMSNEPSCCGIVCESVVEMRYEVLHVLEQYAQLLLIWDQLCRRLRISSEDAIKAALKCLIHANTLITHCLVHNTYCDPLGINITKIHIRTLSHEAVIASVTNNRSKAFKCLSHADALLNSFDPHHERTSWARLCLHRAEVLIQLSLETLIKKTKENDDKIAWKALLDELTVMALNPPHLGLSSYISNISKSDLRSIRADIRDATVALDQAEKAFKRRRKNVWWTTWLFQRRLKIIETELWISLFDNGEPIPYLGLESTTRKSDTLADQLLLNTQRVVRLDIYRLATVVETYANCALALRMRLEMDNMAERLPLRENAMRLYLDDAIKQLERMSNRRQSANLKPASMYVEEYVKNTIAHSKHVLDRIHQAL